MKLKLPTWPRDPSAGDGPVPYIDVPHGTAAAATDDSRATADLCHWRQNRDDVQARESHEAFHFGNVCPYLVAAEVLAGRPDPRDEAGSQTIVNVPLKTFKPMARWESDLLLGELDASQVLEKLDTPEFKERVAVNLEKFALVHHLHPWLHDNSLICQWEPVWSCPTYTKASKLAGTLLTRFPSLIGDVHIDQVAHRLELNDQVAAVREILDRINQLHPDQFKRDEHLPPAFREVDWFEAFNTLVNLVNEIETTVGYAAAHCRICGCSDNVACAPPCSWVEADLCSACDAIALAAGLEA